MINYLFKNILKLSVSTVFVTVPNTLSCLVNIFFLQTISVNTCHNNDFDKSTNANERLIIAAFFFL